MRANPGVLAPGRECNAVRDLVKPAPGRLVASDGGCFPRQREKCRLKCVLGVMLLPEHSAADTQYHRPMPPYQHFERSFIAARDKAPEQLAIGQTTHPRSVDDTAQVVQYRCRLASWHATDS